MAASRSPRPDAGFSLVETLVATLLLAVALVSLAQLFAVATRANLSARTTTTAAVIAQQKLEQLRALTWILDSDGVRVSDTATDTTTDPPGAAGGTGLRVSPATALTENVTGYFDYTDKYGAPLGTGAAAAADGTQSAPDGAVYRRRWSIHALPSDPADTLVLQVYVSRVDSAGGDSAGDDVPALGPDEARLTTVKTRKAP